MSPCREEGRGWRCVGCVSPWSWTSPPAVCLSRANGLRVHWSPAGRRSLSTHTVTGLLRIMSFIDEMWLLHKHKHQSTIFCSCCVEDMNGWHKGQLSLKTGPWSVTRTKWGKLRVSHRGLYWVLFYFPTFLPHAHRSCIITLISMGRTVMPKGCCQEKQTRANRGHWLVAINLFRCNHIQFAITKLWIANTSIRIRTDPHNTT